MFDITRIHPPSTKLLEYPTIHRHENPGVCGDQGALLLVGRDNGDDQNHIIFARPEGHKGQNQESERPPARILEVGTQRALRLQFTFFVKPSMNVASDFHQRTFIVLRMLAHADSIQ